MLTGFFVIHSVVTSELLYEIFISPFYQSGESVKNPIKLLLPSSFWIATAIFPGRSLLRAMYFVSPVSVYVVQIARLRYELVGSSPFYKGVTVAEYQVIVVELLTCVPIKSPPAAVIIR